MEQISFFCFRCLTLSVLFKLYFCNPARVDLRDHDLSHISSEQLRRVVQQNENQDITTDDDNLLEKLYNQTQYHPTNDESRCISCTIREDQKKHRIESIKNRISHALRIDVLGKPNMTNTKLPKIPQFQKLKERYEIREALDMQNDQYRGEREDYEDEFGQSHRTFTFAQNRKYNVFTLRKMSTMYLKLQDCTQFQYD